MNTTETISIRCNQNRIFGCGKVTAFPAVRYVIGESRERIAASGRCACGLPLAVRRDA